MLKSLHLSTCAALLALSFAAPVLAHGVTAGALEIGHPHIPLPPEGAQSAAGYLSIENTGAEADRLIGVSVTHVAEAMLHTTETDAAGVAVMKHLEAVEIPAGGAVTLEPGGMHVMLMGLGAPMVAGDMVPARLIFEHAGEVAVEFSVDAVEGGADSAHDHGAPSN